MFSSRRTPPAKRGDMKRMCSIYLSRIWNGFGAENPRYAIRSSNLRPRNTLCARLPTIFNFRDFVQAGALMSYGLSSGSVPARRRVARQDPARNQTRRYPGRATDDVQARRQPQDRHGAWLDDPRIIPAARRRGDRMSSRREFI